MNGYSKISSQKSRSIDFSDLLSFPQTSKSKRNSGAPPSTAQGTAKLPEDEDAKTEAENGERFGVMLGRSGSVSSAASSGFQATVKRAFSMRRSSSVSEKYCRIHDQVMVIASSSSSSPVREYDDDNNNTITDPAPAERRSTNNKHNHRGGGGGGKILRACKRLLGL